MLPLAVAEAFHLAFLAALQASVGHDRFALKGGGNLRFFYGSLRYSEDIDLDVFDVDPRRFAPKIERAMRSGATERLLAARNIQIVSRVPKEQSTTREKWSVALKLPNLEQPVRTKVDFSYREQSPAASVRVEAVPARVIAPYAPLIGPIIGHYLPPAAIAQKIFALKERAEHNTSQPRDVFDLDMLIRGWSGDVRRGMVPPAIAATAAERAMEMTWPEFRAKVVAYLEPSVAGTFDSKAAWEQIQERVVTALLGIGS